MLCFISKSMVYWREILERILFAFVQGNGMMEFVILNQGLSWGWSYIKTEGFWSWTLGVKGEMQDCWLDARGLSVWVYFGTRGFVWEVGDFQFCYVVGSLKYKKNLYKIIKAKII